MTQISSPYDTGAPTSYKALLNLWGVSLTYPASHGSKQTIEGLRNVDLEVALRDFLCVIGSSGCGKTSLLRILAGWICATDQWNSDPGKASPHSTQC